MKNLKVLGKALSKAEQKSINGGEGNVQRGICLSSGCWLRCDQKCSDGTDPICSGFGDFLVIPVPPLP